MPGYGVRTSPVGVGVGEPAEGEVIVRVELLIARNPDPDSSLPLLVRVPLGAGGLVFRTKGTWPRTSALYCHPVEPGEWPADPQIVERVRLTSCVRRGAAIDVVADRGREQRSQIVFTHARGREMVFWQSPRTRRQARPDVRTPTARAAGVAALEIVVDAHERYPYTFTGQQVRTVRRGLRCGDYAVLNGEHPVGVVERKSLPDLVASLLSGRLRFALGELAAAPRAAVVVEDRYSQIFRLARVRPAVVADGLAELQISYPTVAIVFCETRKLAEEWTYRYLAAASVWADTETAAAHRIRQPSNGQPSNGQPGNGQPGNGRSSSVRTAPGTDATPGPGPGPDTVTPSTAQPSTAQIRSWARANGLIVSDRGRLRPQIHRAWRDAHPPP